MRGKPWSVDEERQLRRLLEEGKSLDEISKIMGKTRTADFPLHRRIVRHGLLGILCLSIPVTWDFPLHPFRRLLRRRLRRVLSIPVTWDFPLHQIWLL